MSMRILMLASITAVLLMTVFVGTAAAQSCGELDFSLDPASGLPGSTVLVSGTGAGPQQETEFYFDTIDAPGFLGQVLSENDGTYSRSVTIPAGATPGAHQIFVSTVDAGEDFFDCPAPFTVEGEIVIDDPPVTPADGVEITVVSVGGTSQQSTASPAPILPATGLPLALPAAGLAAIAAASALLGRRRP